MPCEGYAGEGWKLRVVAERQVQAKFPDLVKGTSGWHRAVENRFKRLSK